MTNAIDTPALMQDLLDGLADTAVQPVLEDSLLAGAVSSPVVQNPRTELLLRFSIEDFEAAVAELDESASSLWPERPPFVRAVALMLIHIEEDLSTVAEGARKTVLVLGSGGNAKVRRAA